MTDSHEHSAPRGPKLQHIDCQECGKPWGVIVPKTHDEAVLTLAKEHLLDDYVEWCLEVWEADVTDKEPPPVMKVPEPDVREVILVRDSDVAWLDNIGVEVWGGEPPCWLAVEDIGAPDWWTKNRKRVAVWWDCCNLDDPRNSDRADELEAAHG